VDGPRAGGVGQKVRRGRPAQGLRAPRHPTVLEAAAAAGWRLGPRRQGAVADLAATPTGAQSGESLATDLTPLAIGELAVRSADRCHQDLRFDPGAKGARPLRRAL
jgi:hypothetical protein